MIINKVEIQRQLRTSELKPCNVLRLDADTLVGIEEEDFVVLERLIHRGQPAFWIRLGIPNVP